MPRESRSRLKISEEEKKIRRREQKKKSIRRARANMTQEEIEDRRQKDRDRYKKKKENGLIKTINDFTPREQRQMRKMWREKAEKKREKEKMQKNAMALVNENTPPSTPSFSRASVGRAVAARNKRVIRAENSYLKVRVLELESKLAKYRMRLVRSKKTTEGKSTNGDNINRTKKCAEVRKIIQNFFETDEISRLTSGKNETITRNKIKKQVRYLNDSLLNLFELFVDKTGLKISFSTFRRNRPFWVLIPKVNARNTCLCITHTNINFLVEALRISKIIAYKSATELVKALCCNNSINTACLEGRCLDCKDMSIECNTFEPNDTATYDRWVTKNVSVVIKGQVKVCKKTVKERVVTTKQELFNRFQSDLPNFTQHVANNIHQLQVIQKLKQQLTPSEGLLHIDFSENYNCKYGEEIQSAHFGGSKPQLTLHTSIYYSTDVDPPKNIVNAKSICTISENLRHDPVLICTHLLPVIESMKNKSPNLKHLHILSDGPSTQYRNKTMFHLVATYLGKILDVDTITWHYSEKGHGKGAPDGVGGCIKRICDANVARGADISNYESLMSCVKLNCKGIEIYEIDESNIAEIQKIADNSTTPPFKGTFNIHQLTWSKRQPNIVHARRLSCLVCAAHTICPHFEIGQITIQSKIPEPSGSSSPRLQTPDYLPGNSLGPNPSRPATPDNLPASPSVAASGSNSSRPQTPNNLPASPGIPATPDASTVPNSPSPPRTPDMPVLPLKKRKPTKRPRPKFLSDSECSECSDGLKTITEVRKRLLRLQKPKTIKQKRLYLSSGSDSSEDLIPLSEVKKRCLKTRRVPMSDSNDESIF